MNSTTPRTAVVIMAAGKGTRMKSDLAKVLHPLCGRPMIDYVLETARLLRPAKVALIVGHQADAVRRATACFSDDLSLSYALQSPQLGTGHAVMQAESSLREFDGDVLVLSGDAPLVTVETLNRLLELHRRQAAVATVLTALVDNPTGYGRVIRSKDGTAIVKMVEQKDASPDELAVKEINSGIYVFRKQALFDALKRITNQNAQQEYYLPDVFNIFFAEAKPVAALVAESFDEIRGVNTPEQLAEAEAILNRRMNS
jgi:UDP-N-acetylglucosamine pyrophosphorylase